MAVLPVVSSPISRRPCPAHGNSNPQQQQHEHTAAQDDDTARTKGHPPPKHYQLLPALNHPQRPSNNSNNKIMAPLHRSILYLVLATTLYCVVALRKMNLTQYLVRHRPTQLPLSQRPILYLHVGPKKTASTTIQTQLLTNPDIVQALKLDNITVGSTEFNYVKVQRLRDECLLRPRHCRTQLLDQFLQDMSIDYPATHQGNAAVVKSCETYSNLPRNAFTARVFHALNQKWQVHVVLVYRRASAWLPSAYHQRRKGNLFYSKAGRYEPFDTGLTDEIAVQPMTHFMDEIMSQSEAFRGDPWSTYDYFVSLYGRQHVIVVDMESPVGVAVDFVCHGLTAPNACRVVQNQTISTSVNDNSQFLFDHDLIVMEAFRQGWFAESSNLTNNIILTTTTKAHNVSHTMVQRREATQILQRLLQHLNWTTTHDLPRRCLTTEQEEALWNRTLAAQQHMSRNPRSPEELRRLFEQVDRPKFCTVDPAAVWANITLRTALFRNPCWYVQKEWRANCMAKIATV